MSPTRQPKFVQLRDVLRVFGLNKRTLYKWEAEGLIKTVRSHGGRRWYRADELEKLGKINVANTKAAE